MIALSVAAAAQEHIPVRQDWMGRMTVKAKVPGGQEGTFMLDLGAGAEIVSRKFAANLPLTAAGYYTGFRMTGERVGGNRYTGIPLAFGTLRTSGEVGVSDHIDKDPIDGLISARTFAQRPTTLDFVNKEVVLETEASARERLRSGSTVPLRVSDDRGLRLDLFAEFDLGNDQKGLCEVDTGFYGIMVHTRYMEALGIVPGALGVDRIEFNPGFFTWKTHLPAIALASAPEQKLEGPLVNFGDIIYDCVVGMRFWHDRTVTLDIAGRKLIVSHKEEAENHRGVQ